MIEFQWILFTDFHSWIKKYDAPPKEWTNQLENLPIYSKTLKMDAIEIVDDRNFHEK